MTIAPTGAFKPVNMTSKVVPSDTLPAKVLERRTKPLPSSTSSVGWAEHSEAQHTGSDVLGFPLVSPTYRADPISPFA